MDGTTIAAIGSSIGSAIELARKLFDAAAFVKDAESKMALADLQIQLAELKTKFADLINENTDLKEQLKKDSCTEEVEFKDFAYFKKSDGSGPHCSTCYETKNHLLVRLTEMPPRMRKLADWKCNSCGATYGGQAAAIAIGRPTVANPTQKRRF